MRERLVVFTWGSSSTVGIFFILYIASNVNIHTVFPNRECTVAIQSGGGLLVVGGGGGQLRGITDTYNRLWQVHHSFIPTLLEYIEHRRKNPF
jgi:hypothetical protein